MESNNSNLSIVIPTKYLSSKYTLIIFIIIAFIYNIIIYRNNVLLIIMFGILLYIKIEQMKNMAHLSDCSYSHLIKLTPC